MAFFSMAGSTLANLFKKPATRLYPAVPAKSSAITRGQVTIDVTPCIFCGICAKKCPTSAIKVDREAKTWEIERLQCIACGNCCEACPKECLSMATAYAPPVTTAERPTAHMLIKGA